MTNETNNNVARDVSKNNQNPNPNSRLTGGAYVPTFNQNDTQLSEEEKKQTGNVIEREEDGLEQTSHIPDKNVISKNTANTLENGEDVTG